MNTLQLPKLCLVVLVGPSGSGKTSFAHRAFRSTEVLSSDAFRAMVRDDEARMEGNADAFEVLHLVARKRLAAGLLTVIDATNVQAPSRAALVRLAREHHVLPVAIVLDLPVEVCVARNQGRADRPDSERYVRRQHHEMRSGLRGRSAKGLEREGFRHVHVLSSVEEVDAAVIERRPMWSDRRDDVGPFDIIGDVHGCLTELEQLLVQLGYAPHPDRGFAHPDGRRVIFLGDLVDRGPRNLDVLRLAMRMVAGGTALAVPGNHDAKLKKWLSGKKVQLTHGLDRTVAEIEALPDDERVAFTEASATFIDGLVSHLVLDRGRLVVAHAGMKQEMQGRGSQAVRAFALYGETTGEIDAYGLPVRADWAAAYRGEATVVYGHTPVVEPEWLNRTICIDTGCVFGGKLTALRWPEQELVSTDALDVYCEPVRPLQAPTAVRAAQHVHDDLLDLADIQGKRVVHTRLSGAITIQADTSAAALETLGRFAADPRWLIYLPPTMSPPATSKVPGLLEHPAEAFAYYRELGVQRVVCETKHMGSRAILVVARSAEAAAARFGVKDGSTGSITTRTGRPFFHDATLGEAVLQRLRSALDRAGWWSTFDSDWFCLDAEILPWSAKAVALLRSQYAPVGTAGRLAAQATCEVLAQAAQRNLPVAELLARHQQRAHDLADFSRTWRGYCWDVAGLDDHRIAPFHLLASEGAVHTDKPHTWHMETLAGLCASDAPWLTATAWRAVDLHDEAACAEATAWWTQHTDGGGEGMVVKPEAFVHATPTRAGRSRVVQPAIKVRGPSYLRIIYGPEYTRPEHLERLRGRTTTTKRALAIQEFALGVEALERFVRREPLRAVHACVAAILALESDPVDPRL